MAPASTTPTAMPSGMLCSVTANTSIVDLRRSVFTPSGSSESICWCGTSVSNNSSENMPARKPTVAGSHPVPPCSTVMSIEGMSSDHTDAAIITPDANPNSSLRTRADMSRRSRKTIAAPSEVPAKGIRSPYATAPSIMPFSISDEIIRGFRYSRESCRSRNANRQTRHTNAPYRTPRVYPTPS